MSQVAAFDVALLNRVETMPQQNEQLVCRVSKKKRIHVFLFLTIKIHMTNENTGYYLNMWDGGHMVRMLCGLIQHGTPGQEESLLLLGKSFFYHNV